MGTIEAGECWYNPGARQLVGAVFSFMDIPLVKPRLSLPMTLACKGSPDDHGMT